MQSVSTGSVDDRAHACRRSEGATINPAPAGCGPIRRYVYARLSSWDFGVLRVFGAGLGNLLFPWARSMVLARSAGLIPIFPTWPQLKLGPIFRRERDARTYQDLFRPTSEYIS